MAKYTRYVSEDQKSKKLPASTRIRHMLVTIHTGTCESAGTDANVVFQVGANEYPLDRMKYDDFERGDTDDYGLDCDMTLGELRQSVIELGHDGKGHKPGWFVDWVRLQVKPDGSTLHRLYKKWTEIGWLDVKDVNMSNVVELQPGEEL